MTHPAVRDLFQSFASGDGFQQIVRGLAAHRHQALSGLTLTAKALYTVLLWKVTGRPLIVVTDGAKEAELLLEAIRAFFEILAAGQQHEPPQMIPALDVLPSQGLSPHNEISEQRAVGLWRLATRRATITVTPVGSALARTYPGAQYRHLALDLRTTEDIAMDDLAEHLRRIGYEQREPVEMVGEFSVRGGIIDIFPAQNDLPIRIELFGDTIEEMRRFDVQSQRSVLKVTSATILPLAEHTVPANPVSGWEFVRVLQDPRESTMFDLQMDALVLLDEPEQIRGAAERLWKRLNENVREETVPNGAIYSSVDDWTVFTESRATLSLRELELIGESAASNAAYISTRPSIAFHGDLQAAVGETRNLAERGHRVVYFAPAVGEVERLADIFHEYQVPFQLALDPGDHPSPYLAERARLFGSSASTMLARGLIRRGTTFLDAKVTVIGSEDLFDPSDLVASPAINHGAAAAFAADIADLRPGDFIVHVTHGVGKFLGIKELAQGEQKGEFLLLEYAGESRLYVPMSRLDLVQKYRGAGEQKPSLDRLGGVTWSKTKTRVKAKMRDMAEELLKLYAARKMSEGFAYSPDSNWQREFEDAFEFSATKDQIQAVSEIKRDMERAQPMDRLLCGDVGFGKTEVAMRAAFKALGDGKQVAVLTPTTVLCFQHFESFKRRFASFPVRVEMLSRFRSAAETKQVLEDLKFGKVDIVIGTHRILSKDVEYSDLGLLVVDEEQRFGVRHKERLKELRKNIDVLTMSATPIPRTLHMSMLGLRDMSVIETPPKDRLAVQTTVAHFNEDLVKAAIETEVLRGGQVYFVHNRVDTIYNRAMWLQDAMPNVRVGVGHGQLPEAELERILLGFMKREYDVFVCTTIVENGLDIPLANTIVIENAERHGLSELYQLRGRVGRSNRRAYAYLLVPPNTELSDVARKRLAALREFSDLGAGFKIAALDLELRGCGNLLGGEQHGHIESVGFDTYLKLLDDMVRELKGEDVPPEIHSTITLGVDIRIPNSYIGEEIQRLRAYKKLAGVENTAEQQRAIDELTDRYGPVPEMVRHLAGFSLLRAIAQRLGIESVDRRQGYFNIKIHPEARISPENLMALVAETPGCQFTPAGVLRLPADPWPVAKPEAMLRYLQETLRRLEPMPVPPAGTQRGRSNTAETAVTL
ncbi:MAG: transcription-repair coupling factor [Acidobacteria bacterium]|nr:transcription-repair coupling factor [Acidobacteriota bacterium]